MARGRVERVLITSITAERAKLRPDDLVVEEPMSIRLDGTLVATTMRTPGHDFELAAGFCFTDGLLHGASVRSVRYCADATASDGEWNIVTVDTGNQAPEPAARLGNTTSSCGLCGREAIETLVDQLAPLEETPAFTHDVLAQIPATVLGAQQLFNRTGAVHAAAAFTADGNIVCSREDVGRHNAVDKVVGRLLLNQQLPATGLGLFVSGRASFELVQKAWAGGFSTLIAVSAPTALAVATARRARLTLAGFVRNDRMNIYAPERPDYNHLALPSKSRAAAGSSIRQG